MLVRSRGSKALRAGRQADTGRGAFTAKGGQADTGKGAFTAKGVQADTGRGPFTAKGGQVSILSSIDPCA